MNNERLCDHTLFMRSILVFRKQLDYLSMQEGNQTFDYGHGTQNYGQVYGNDYNMDYQVN